MPPRTQPLIEKDILVTLYFDEGLSMRAIAEKTGTNYRLVRDSFKKHELSWRSKSEARAGRSWDEATKAKIAASRTGHKDSPETAALKREVLAKYRGWSKGLTAETDPRVARMQKAVRQACRTPEFRARQSRIKAAQIEAGGYWDRGYVQTNKSGKLYFMSSWEEARWLELDADPTVKAFTRHPCRIPYEWEVNRHLYLPDVLVEYDDGLVVLEEIKPLALVQDAREKNNKLAASLAAGASYADAQGWGWRILSYNEKGGASFTSS